MGWSVACRGGDHELSHNLKGGYEMNVHEPCLFSKFAVREEQAVDGGSIALGEFVGCVLLEVDDHLMGGPGKAQKKAWRDYGRGSSLESGTGCYRTGRLSSEDVTQLPDRSFKVDMTRFIRERLRPISVPRGRCLDRSAEATEGKVKALRAVAGSLSWIARLNSARFGIRAVVKDLSDANRAVNRLKQTEVVGLLVHAIPLVNLRTVSMSDAALDLVRPGGPTQGGFMVGFTTSALHQQGSAESCHPYPGRRTR